MTAKSKRPFYVFAAVAFLCCMVMVAGVRGSRADDGRSPLLAGPQILDRAPTLIPSTDEPGSVTDGDPGATGGAGPGGSDAPTPDLGRPPLESEIEGPEAREVPQSGVGVLAPPDFATPPEAVDPGVTPPVTDEEEPGTKGRGHKKDKDKGKDGQGGPPGPETPPAGPPTNPEAPETQSEDLEPEAEPTP